MRNLLVVLGLVACCAGCKKGKTETPAAPDVAAQAQALVQALGGLPDAATGPTWTAGALKQGAAIEALGITVDYPENVTLAVDGNTAKFTAEGFYPVTISTEKLTLDNAALKVTVNGVPQLSPGQTTDGKTNIVQTDCTLIKCTVETPDGWYAAGPADAGRAICASIQTPPSPKVPAVANVTSSNSTGGPCPDGTMDLGTPFLDAVKADDMKAALEKCWTDAVAANAAWKGKEPTLNVMLRFWENKWQRTSELHDLEGDAATLQACFDAALAALDAKLPTAPLEGNCTLTTVAYVHFGEKVACP